MVNMFINNQFVVQFMMGFLLVVETRELVGFDNVNDSDWSDHRQLEMVDGIQCDCLFQVVHFNFG